MTCSDVRKTLSGLALGDLDAEPAAEVHAHLKSCPECRAEEAAIGRTLGALRRAAPVPASTERRSAAVSAMLRAHGDQAEKLLVRPRSVAWIPLAAAAVFLLVVVAALNLRAGGTPFTVATVTHGANFRDRESGDWRPVLEGMTFSAGDRLVTEKGCKMRLTSGTAELLLDEETEVDLVAPRRFTLEAGRVMAVAPPSEVLIISDRANNGVRVAGRVELSLREIKASVAGSKEVKGQKPVIPEPTTLIKKSIVARVEKGEVALDGDRGQLLRAAAGQQGTFTFGGKPETAPLEDSRVGTWADELGEGR